MESKTPQHHKLDTNYITERFYTLFILLGSNSIILFLFELFEIKTRLPFVFLIASWIFFIFSFADLLKVRGKKRNINYEFSGFIYNLCLQIWCYIICFEHFSFLLKVYYPFLAALIISFYLNEMIQKRTYRKQIRCTILFLVVVLLVYFFPQYQIAFFLLHWSAVAVMIRECCHCFIQYEFLLKKGKPEKE